MQGSSERRELDRRGFLQLVAGALAALPATAAAQTPAAKPATTPAATPATPPEHSGGEARLLTEVLRSRYPERFSEAQWASVVSDFDGDLGSGRRLRAVKLKNADEPDFTFRP